MSTNSTSSTLPIFQKGAKVKLATGVSLPGKLRCGPGLQTEFLADTNTHRYTSEHDLVFKIHKADPRPRTSMAIAGGQADPLDIDYRLILPTNETRIVYEEGATIPSILHVNLRMPGAHINQSPGLQFNKNERAVLIKSMPLVPDGATRPIHYPEGQLVKIMSVPLTTRGQPASTNTPLANCRYEVVVLEKKVYKDVFWKAQYPVTVTSLRAA